MRFLSHTLTRRPTSHPQDILTWFAQIVLALQLCHRKRVLHRDLKSQNIYLTDSMVVRCPLEFIVFFMRLLYKKKIAVLIFSTNLSNHHWYLISQIHVVVFVSAS